MNKETREVRTIKVKDFAKQFIEEIEKLGLKSLDFPTFIVQIPETDIVVSYARVNDNAFLVVVSQADIIKSTENFVDPVTAANNMLFKIRNIQQQVTEAKKQNEQKVS